MKKQRLTQKMRLFADNYLKCGNVTQAAKEAGYRERSAYSIGSENLKKPEVKAYLQQRRIELEEVLGFSKGTIINDLLEIKKKCMQITQVNEKEEKIGLYEFDSNGAVRAISEINKMMDYYSPIKMEDLTPPENKIPIIQVHKQYVIQHEQDSSST